MTSSQTPTTRTRLSRTAKAVDEYGSEVSVEERVVEHELALPDGSAFWKTSATLLLMTGGRSLRATRKEGVFEAWRSSGELVTVTRWSECRS
ncbi:hypothetical protein [Variovorax saccharolyticus]|uniref:hypothetical protein n=1 Tax=Variovorax saccharolyticus TaxID=3053516 RepID=UPI0025791473|nr:hypothetical protein [Variovorax sp. J31P216]MDM0030477.1 hypothetical protein [Variovorax sp. J31P216]